MEIPKFNNYEIAEISTNDELKISALEKTLSSETKQKIILIAYQQKDKAEG